MCDSKCPLDHTDAFPHTTKLVKTKHGNFHADKGIAKLLEKIWEHNLRTEMSCENNMNCSSTGDRPYVQIVFETAADAEKFIDIVVSTNVVTSEMQDTKSDNLYNRILGRGETENSAWCICLYQVYQHESKKMAIPLEISFPHCDFQDVCFAFGIE